MENLKSGILKSSEKPNSTKTFVNPKDKHINLTPQESYFVFRLHILYLTEHSSYRKVSILVFIFVIVE